VARIVFCEDDVAVQKLIRVALRGSPHESLLADDGMDGLALILRERPHMIFTDLAMPRLSGLELCLAVRRDPALAALPIVILTASVQRSQVETSFQHGATDLLAKPFTMAQLRDKIRQYVG
jgi:CheY-like chemotaxis protein